MFLESKGTSAPEAEWVGSPGEWDRWYYLSSAEKEETKREAVGKLELTDYFSTPQPGGGRARRGRRRGLAAPFSVRSLFCFLLRYTSERQSESGFGGSDRQKWRCSFHCYERWIQIIAKRGGGGVTTIRHREFSIPLYLNSCAR